MGKSWKKAGMLDVAQKKGKVFTKCAREIFVATKLGGPDPDGNPRLKLALKQAASVSCPKNTVERAIKKGSGQIDDGEKIEEVIYEGQGPHNVGIMVVCQTDNRNRSVSDIRGIFKKNSGTLGDKGSSAWMFDAVCLIEGSNTSMSDAEEEAIEAGADDVEDNEDGTFSFYGDPAELDNIRVALVDRSWDVTTAELSFKAKTPADISEDDKNDVIKLLEALDDNDDAFRIYSTID